jgi:hypothetical protein
MSKAGEVVVVAMLAHGGLHQKAAGAAARRSYQTNDARAKDFMMPQARAFNSTAVARRLR